MSPFFSGWMDLMIVAMVSGSLMAAGIYLLLRLLPRGFTELRAWVWWLAGVKFLLGLFIAIRLPIPAPVLPSVSAVVAASGAASESLYPASRALRTAPELPGVPWSPSLSFVPVAFLVWVGGIAVCAFLFATQVLVLRRILRTAEPLEETVVGAMARRLAAKAGMNHPPRVVVSDVVTTPFTTDPFRPVIVLPAALLEILSDAEIEMMLAHELAHVRRGDLLLAIPLALAGAVFWFFPPVRFCVRAWDTARESACDAMALRLTEGSLTAYGELLMKVVEADFRQLSLPAFGVSASFHTLKARIGDLNTFAAGRPWERPVTMVSLFVGLVLALPVHVTAQNSAAKKGGGVANLVRNAGFEEGAEVPNGWLYGSLLGIPQAQVVRDTAAAHAGKASLRFTKTAPTFAPVALVSQTLPPVPSGATGVRLRVWVKAKNVRKATVAVLLGQADGTTSDIVWGAYVGEVNDGDRPATHDWKAYDAVIPLPAGTRAVTLAAQMYGPGTVWFDDVSASYETVTTKGKSK